MLDIVKSSKVRAIIQEQWYPSATSKLVADKSGAAFVKISGYPAFASGQNYVAFMNALVAQLAGALHV